MKYGIISPFGYFLTPDQNSSLSLGLKTSTSLTSVYAENGFEPGLVLDFRTGAYKFNGSTTPLTALGGNGRDSLGTMVDSEGLLKWAPHNLQMWSDDLPQGFNAIGDSALVDFETFTFDTGYISSSARTPISVNSGEKYTIEIELWTETDIGETVDFGFELTGQTNQFTPPITLTETPTQHSLSVSITSATILGIRIRNPSGKEITVKARKVRVYRSDLGGMVNNPDTGDSYVPTTDAAVYMDRVGHHVYEGGEWVNAGRLTEPARTNLLTHSNDFENAAWIKTRVTVTDGVAEGLDGLVSAASLTENTDTNQHYIQYSNLTVVSGSTYTASIFAKTNGRDFVVLSLFNGFPVNEVWFDIANGTVGTSTGTVDAATVENYGNGFFRCSISVAATSNNNSASLFVKLADSDGSNNYTGDGSSGVYISGAQFEPGSTPTSYIPTNGSTVTRAADTLPVPAAYVPWPEPNVIGPELVENGTFDTDVSGWFSGRDSPTFSWDPSGAILVDHDGTGTYRRSSRSAPISLEAGKVYIISAKMVSSTVFEPGIALSTSASNDTTENIIPLYGPFYKMDDGETANYIFADQHTGDYYIHLVNGGEGLSVWDNVSIREIDPLALTIQMDGRVTRVDNGTTDSRLVDIQNGSSSIRIEASGVIGTGRFEIGQHDGTTYSAIYGSTNLEEGINVPFNVAGTYASTSVSGAVDGISLTPNITPTALPDLEAVDLEITPDFNGTIGQVRVWPVDIGDTGREASTVTDPIIYGLPSISGDLYVVGGTLTATSASVIIGTPTPTTTWQWLRDGVSISGATNSTYVLTEDDAGAQISVGVHRQPAQKQR
jgi:hypothetical protein